MSQLDDAFERGRADCAASRAACGLPPKVEDPAVLRQVARMLLTRARMDRPADEQGVA